MALFAHIRCECAAVFQKIRSNSPLRKDFAKRGYLRLHESAALAKDARALLGNRLFTMAHDCIGKAPLKSIVNSAAPLPARFSVRLSAL
jgi:hypothetical protein